MINKNYIAVFKFRGIVCTGFTGTEIYFDEEMYLVKLNAKDIKAYQEFLMQCYKYTEGVIKHVDTVELW